MTSGPADEDSQRLHKARVRVGQAMTTAVGLWFLPLASGVACNMVEKSLIEDLLPILGHEEDENVVDTIFWFLRKRMLLFNVATYAPYVGTALQILEVYAIGEFTIRCVSQHTFDLTDESAMRSRWDEIESEMFSGEKVVASYAQYTSQPFPENIRANFISAVDTLSQIYRAAERVPGLSPAQEVAGEAMRKAIQAGMSAGKWVKRRFE